MDQGSGAPPPVPPPAADQADAAQPPLPQGEQGGEPAPTDPPPEPPAGQSAAGDADQEEPEEEDPLVVAEREAERERERERERAEAADVKDYDDPALKEFYNHLREVDRENEVNRILGAFKLNPFEQLGVKFTVTPEDVRRAYRKASLMVHPDKCKHARAKDAFEILGEAQKLLLDEERRENVLFLLAHARDEVLAEWRKAAKHDAAVRLAAAINEDGRTGVEAAYQQTDEFHERWKMKARDVMARTEWRKRKLTKRIAADTERAKEEHKATKAEAKKKRDHEKKWEKTRDTRVGTWRDFMTQKSKKSKGGSIALGGLKPPKMKESDEDKRYIQRPVGEQFRPPPAKGDKPMEWS